MINLLLICGRGGEYVSLLKIEVISWSGICIKVEIVRICDPNSICNRVMMCSDKSFMIYHDNNPIYNQTRNIFKLYF